MKNLVLKTAPSVEPVDIDEAKAHLRVTIGDDDDLIKAMICAARRRAEAFTQRAFITQSWYLYFDWQTNRDGWGWPALLRDGNREANLIKVPYPPLISLDAFEYQSDADVWSAIDASTYYLDMPGNQIVMTDCLPEPARHRSGFRATFTAGYGTKGTSIPEDIKLGINTIILHLYENRSAYDATAQVAIPMAGESLLMPYKMMDY